MRALLLAALLLGVAAPARAQTAAEAYQRAKRAHEEGRYAEAAAAYLEAYELGGRKPELLFNAAQVYRLGGERAKALEYYEKYLAADPDGRAAPEAYGHATALRSEIRAAEEAEARRRAEEQAQAAEARRVKERAEVEARARRDAQAARERALAQSGESRRWRLYGLGAAGGGVVLAVIGGAFHLQAAAKADDVEGAGGRWSDALADADAAGRRAETRAVVFYLLGGAALAAGGGMYVYGMTLAPRDLEVAPTVSSDGAGVQVQMSF